MFLCIKPILIFKLLELKYFILLHCKDTEKNEGNLFWKNYSWKKKW